MLPFHARQGIQLTGMVVVPKSSMLEFVTVKLRHPCVFCLQYFEHFNEIFNIKR